MMQEDINKKKTYIKNLYREYCRYTNYITKGDFARFVLRRYQENVGPWSFEGVRKFVNRHLPDLVEVSQPVNKPEPDPLTPKNVLKQDGNELLSVGNSRRGPLSEQEIIDLFKIDTSIWKSISITTNSWTVTNRRGEQYLNWQTKIIWVRRVPIAQEIPTINSVTISTKNYNDAHKKFDLNRRIHRAIILGDLQLGYARDLQDSRLYAYHDRKAWDISVKIAHLYKPDLIILCGDMLDLPNWSDHFIRSPEMYWTTQPSLEEFYWMLARLRSMAPDAEIIYLEGNHELRMKSAMYNHLLEAYQIKPANKPNDPPSLSIDSLLDLKSLNIRYSPNYPNNEHWINDNLECHHGNTARKGSGDTTRAVLNDTRNSQIIAHAHRMEMASKTVHPRGRAIQYIVATVGVLCKIDGSVPSNARKENWQQGIITVDYETGNGLFDINQVFINNGKAIFNGIVLEGEEYLNELIKDTENRWKYV